MEIGYVNADDCFVIVYKGVFNSMLLLAAFLLGWFVYLLETHQCTQVYNQLRASGRSWFRTIIMMTEKQVIVFCVVFHDIILSCEIWSVSHANERWKLMMQLETNIGSELPLTSFTVTHPGLTAVTVDMF